MNPIFPRLFLVLAGFCLLPVAASAVVEPTCAIQASDACYFLFQPAPAGRLHYYASLSPYAASGTSAPTSALIVIHGHPRDANVTFDAALAAAKSAGVDKNTLIIAPVFQVAAGRAEKCSTSGVPAAQAGDLLWTCGSWLDGSESLNGQGVTSFSVTDALVDEVVRRWPTLRVVTVAGFSAGAQMVQHYIGFAASGAGHKVTLRYVIADPGTWLYFDDVRPVAETDGQTSATPDCLADRCRYRFSLPDTTCPMVNQWKYGTLALPDSLKRSASDARATYIKADVHYLEAAQDSGTGPGTYARILDKSCAAEAQGSFRLQRGLAYAAYDRDRLAPQKQRRVIVIPDCAHDVTCVWTSSKARDALFESTP